MGSEIVVKVVEKERIFEMDVVEAMVVVEVDGMDSMDFSMEDI